TSMIDDAKRRGVSSVIVTFDRDPDEFFSQKRQVRKLLSNKDRIDLLATLGADYVLCVPFGEETAVLSYQEFIEAVLCSFMNPKCFHVGCDFKLGSHALGNVCTMTQWGTLRECECVGYDLLRIGDHPVTATRIRELLAEGDVAGASLLLGRDHYVRGIVEHGRGAGKGFGIPTANVSMSVSYTPIKDGVYAGYVTCDGESHKAAISVGLSPTFQDARCTLEPHLVDFDGDLYGKEVTVSFVARLRDLIEFTSTEELISTINANIEWVRKNLD
ncbi:MAG: riboflavin biosynthesis protein RibF, partial [Actinobacteria bacterium]|nr:riboflavin biosynthesis protein RibF [Actinomycetota bacterium]